MASIATSATRGAAVERLGASATGRVDGRLRTGPKPAAEHVDDIVEAAVRCFQRWGVARTRVDDIATELGKARPYIYRFFASKDAIILEVVVRSIRQHNVALRERFALEGRASDLIVDSLMTMIRHAHHNPYTAALVADDSMHQTAQTLARAPEVQVANREYWEPVLDYARTTGELRPGVEVGSSSRWLVFLQFSYLTVRELVPESDDDLRQQLRDHVVPSLLVSPASRL